MRYLFTLGWRDRQAHTKEHKESTNLIVDLYKGSQEVLTKNAEASTTLSGSINNLSENIKEQKESNERAMKNMMDVISNNK